MATPSSSPRRSVISPLDAHLGFWLRFVSNHVSSRFQGEVEAHGVSVSEWVALRQLYGKQDTSPLDLMDALGMTKGAVSKIVTRLEDKGLLRRSESPLDRRMQQLDLTAEGRRLVPKLARVADQNDAHFFGHLTEERRRRLIEAMKELVHHHELKAVPFD